MKPEYFVIEGSSAEDLKCKVDEKLAYGWELQGGIAVGDRLNVVGARCGMQYLQAMVRR